MNKLLLILSFFITTAPLFSQSDNCSGAPSLAVTATCGSPIAGTSAGASMSIPGCVGNADDDVWYKFVATGTSHSITVTGSASFDAVLEVFSGTCTSLTSLVCMDNTFSGQAESVNLTGLTIGATYYVRIFHYGTGSGSSTFTTCLTNPPPPPANDNCVGAINLTVGTGCTSTAGTAYGATQSMPACVGTADDDVWFKFTANSYTQTINVTGSASMDPVLELFNGSACGTLASLECEDLTFSGGTETINAVGLVPGQVYYFRIYDYYSGGGYSYSVCVVGNPIPPGTQPNDNPCTAILLPPVTSSCNYLAFSTIGATATGSGLAPTPSTCTGGSGAMIGGFSASSHDVWFKVVVPASGNLYITPQPNFSAPLPAITDGVMALYSGPCGSLTQIKCSDDNTAYPGTVNDLLPYIAATGLTPGATYYIRYFGFGTTSGNFGLCVQSPTNDNCANALYVCDINGYGASTSAAYTPDRPGTGPGQMFGNNETSAGVNQPDGTNTGGVFGYYPFPGTTAGPYSSPLIDVNIENNSWIRFTAASPVANLRVTVGNCWVGNYPSGGIQMQVFSGLACNSFTPVSSFKEGSSTFTVTATSLVVGNDYYLMVDGYAGDICNYTIQALDGVAFPAIKAFPDSVCAGQSTILTAPSGATAYEWLPGGQTTQTISVIPGSTQTFSCIVSGVCGFKQTLAKTVYVKAYPIVAINSGSAISTCGTKTTTLIGSGAASYLWNTGATTSSISVSPTSTTSYTLTGTTLGCPTTTVTTITVNPIPTVSSASSTTLCAGSSLTLTATGAVSYTWTPGGTGASIVVSPASTTNYTVIGTAANSCTNSAVKQVTVVAKPTISVASSTVCRGTPLTLTASGGNTYNWSTGLSGPSISVTPTLTTAYTVTGTAISTCTNVATATVTVRTPPQMTGTPTVSPSNCGVSTGSITSVVITGAPTLTYSWTNTSSTLIGTTPNLLNIPAGTYNLVVRDGNGCTSTFGPYSVSNPGAPAAPTASALATNICVGATINLFASGAAGATYNWSGPNSFASTLQNPTIPSATTLMSGVYTVYNTLSGCSGPATSVTVTVNSLPNPTASSSALSYCVGQTISLFSSSATTYTWTGPGGFTSNLQNPTLPATTSASGLYQLAVTNAAGCSNTTTLNVTVNSLPTAVASANSGMPICAASTISLSAIGGSTYSWSGPNGFSSLLQNPTISSAGALNAGQYTVTVTNTLTGCTAQALTTVTINPLPTFTANTTNTNVCNGGSFQLNAGGTGLTYSWTGPNSFNSTSQNPLVTNASTLNAGTYTVTVTDANNCSSSQNVLVNVYSVGFVTAGANADIYSGTAPLTVNFGNTSTGVTTTDGFNWNFDDGSSSTDINPTHIFNDAGTFEVILTVTDIESGCSDTATVVIRVEGDLVIVVPNVFTPNNDGANDLFHINLKGAKSAEGFIYNRWGQLLHSWNALNDSWDGNAGNGEHCPDATYYYLIKVIDNKDKEHLFPGYVLIMR